MFNFIEKMHGKSESKRRMLTIGVSLVVVLIIFGVWFSVRIRTSQTEIAKLREHSSSPFTTLNQNIASTFAGFKDSIDALGTAMNAEAQKELEKRAVQGADQTEESTENQAAN